VCICVQTTATGCLPNCSWQIYQYQYQYTSLKAHGDLTKNTTTHPLKTLLWSRVKTPLLHHPTDMTKPVQNCQHRSTYSIVIIRTRSMAFGNQVRGFKPGRSRRIFQGEKILSAPSFGRAVKPWVPCRWFKACKKSLGVSWKSASRLN
jgi:hypothetical protein